MATRVFVEKNFLRIQLVTLNVGKNAVETFTKCVETILPFPYIMVSMLFMDYATCKMFIYFQICILMVHKWRKRKKVYSLHAPVMEEAVGLKSVNCTFENHDFCENEKNFGSFMRN